MISAHGELSKFPDFRTYEIWLKLPVVNQRFYSEFPATLKSELSDFYKQKPHLLKVHEKRFKEKYYDEYIIKANEFAIRYAMFEHQEWLNANYKYQYDSKYMHVVREENLVFVPVYWGTIWRLMIYELNTGKFFQYAVGKFTEDIYLMLPADMVKFDAYTTGADAFYNINQRLQHPSTIEAIKSIPKFKYLPVDKFEKVNYFRLFQASDEMIYNYELLLKFGAFKAASELLYDGRILERSVFLEIKDTLQKNHSVYYGQRKKEKEIEKMKINQLDVALQKMKRFFYEYAGYIFRTPVAWGEFVNETKKLNHCVGQNDKYIKKMVSGTSTIFFMRKKDMPDEPYYTVEIDGANVLQCQTTSHATDPKILQIVKEWNRERLTK